MKNDYSKTTLAQGRDNQQRHQETPTTFGTSGGTSNISGIDRMDQPKQRMAGRVGQRALDYMTDSAEQQRTNKWMEAFGMSNEGANFNLAKMNGGMPMV